MDIHTRMCVLQFQAPDQLLDLQELHPLLQHRDRGELYVCPPHTQGKPSIHPSVNVSSGQHVELR